MFALIALLFFAAETPDLQSMKDTAAELRELSKAELARYETASSAHLALVSRFHRSLRAWVESHLPPLSATNEDCARVSADLTARLRDAGVFMTGEKSEYHSITLLRPQEYPEVLLLRVDVGLPYGVDGSAYLYAARNGRWQQVFAHERRQNEFGNVLNKVAFSSADPEGNHLVLALTTPVVSAGCVHGFGYDLYRVGPDIRRAVPILSRGETSDICYGAGEVTMERDGFRIDFTALDRGAERRAGVVHYKVRGNLASRITPVALKPEDFVDEWLQRTWFEAREWSAYGNEKALRAMHEGLNGKDSFMTSYTAAHRCGETDRWQVRVDVADTPTRYFLISEPAKQQYQMMAISSTPNPGCK